MRTLPSEAELAVMDEIQRRVLWLSTNIIEVANHRREHADGLKVGGHQASCASMVTLMTALYLHHLDADDFVAVKPHGGPVLHALNYLLGRLDRSKLDQLRTFGGLQAYPSRTKDPDQVDFSTGSVGLGPAATLFAARTRQYVDAHFGARPPSRFVAVLGDAELDEGNIWEAVHDSASSSLGAVTWLVDFNRQSLDRIVPDIRISPWHAAFSAHGWQVIEVKYGHRLTEFVAGHDGEPLQEWIDAMPNERYQSLFGLSPADLREHFLQGAPETVARLLSGLTDQEVTELVTDLGGHDLPSVIGALDQADADPSRPAVIFAYTHKGYGLPIQGQARNHSAMLTTGQMEQLRENLGVPADDEWAGFDPGSPAGRLLASRAEHLRRSAPAVREPGHGSSDPSVQRENCGEPGQGNRPQSARRENQRPLGQQLPVVPEASGCRASRPMSTQEGFGRILMELSRDEKIRPWLVTSSPDVATSTNLAGWINRVGVFARQERQTWSDDPVLRWREHPGGQHLELGISEMNLFLLLGQLGLAETFSGQRLLPVGALYDPFVCRGLDALIYGLYSGASFIVAGTPSGVTLAPEGGAHQSSVTASLGTELPGLTYHEPAYVQALDWLFCDALAKVASSDDLHPDSAYFRLTTRVVSQQPFDDALARLGTPVLRRQVLDGAYLLRDTGSTGPQNRPRVSLVASGAVLPEVLAAADELAGEGIAADVVDVTSPGRLYHAWHESQVAGIESARVPALPGVLRACFGHRAPIVTVQDAASHQLAWLGSALGVPAASLGVDAFGQSGTIPDLYAANHLDPGSIVNAALALLPL